ncbi:MAG: GAF domain-containing protein [Candidatus Wallbacteria bacterium]|nr:GAF domain-containing protein [Candidatus Wallbacteria bacterium]
MTMLRRKDELLQARMRLSEFAVGHSHQELLQRTLDEAEGLTGSTIGFLHFVDDDEKSVSLECWSTRTKNEMCRALPEERHYSIDRAGIWVDCVRERRAVIHNDYASTPHKTGLPSGHAPIVRELLVPVFRGGRIVAIMGVGNKSSDYDSTDLEIATELANMAWDIALQKRAQEDLMRLNVELEARVRQRTEDLEAANKELEAFAYSVSHDLRAPLHGIAGLCQVLEEDHAAKLDPDARECLRRMRTCTDRMNVLIAELLKLSRLTRTELTRRELDLSQMALEVGAELATTVSGREVSLQVGPDLRARGDPTLIRVVLVNLLSNAYKFTARRPSAHIDVGGGPLRGNQPVFFVRDDGAGFDPAHSARLFRIFERLHRPADFPGTGVGLATVQRIIHRHGGQVWADGGPGLGATFYFTLPAA